jgi:hypothetical protein
VKGLGFRGLGFRVQERFIDPDLRFRVKGAVFQVEGLEFRV